MKTAHISGHLDLLITEFEEHYIPKIQSAIDDGHNFVVGSTKGADLFALKYLRKNLKDKSRVTVYNSRTTTPVDKFEGFNCCAEKFDSFDAADYAMTMNSDYDIAWVREGRENSSTAKNLERRKNKK